MLSLFEKNKSLAIEKTKVQYILIEKLISDFIKFKNEGYSRFFDGFEDIVNSGKIPLHIMSIINDKESRYILNSDYIDPLCSIVEAYIKKNRHLKKSGVPKATSLSASSDLIIDRHIVILDEEFLFIEKLIIACEQYLYLVDSVEVSKDVEDLVIIAKDEEKTISDLIKIIEEINNLLWMLLKKQTQLQMNWR